MQWSAEPNAGFSSPEARPWMTVNKDHIDWNVLAQLNEKDSIFSFWKSMLAFRKRYADILVYGAFI
jgi:oligo-1,6-glucosidase